MPLRSDSSDFSDGGLGTLTEADYAVIDAASNFASSRETTSKGMPKVEIAVEDEDALPEAPVDTRSMYERFRFYKRLSVSDLVGPAWCEVQFEYGLLQKRWKSLEHRPASFVSRNGKDMSVKKDVAAVNNKVLKRGTFVHKKLERELNPEKTVVQVATDEEHWGVRIVDMLLSIHSLLAQGHAREMPVFGFVQGHIITGIIDELIRETAGSPDSPKRLRSPASTPRKCKKRRQLFKLSKGQSVNTHFASSSDCKFIDLAFDESQTEDLTAPRCYQHTLHLIETKTRRRESLPSDEDALPSRLQLMLYHRLLSSLISPEIPFDFTRLWDETNVDPARPFSETFLSQAGSSLGTYPAFTCLDDLTVFWRNATLELDIPGIDPCLQLIYRRQQPLEFKEDITTPSPARDPSISQFLSSPPNKIFDLDTEESSAELLWALQESWLRHLNDVSGKSVSNDAIPPVFEPSASTFKAVDLYKIIGTKEFNLDDDFLDDYLTGVLDWWMGRRRPRGVSATQTWRCNSCEYMSDCEWRTERALEIKVQAAERRAKSVPPLP